MLLRVSAAEPNVNVIPFDVLIKLLIIDSRFRRVLLQIEVKNTQENKGVIGESQSQGQVRIGRHRFGSAVRTKYL